MSLDRVQTIGEGLMSALSSVVVGQEKVLEGLVTALLAGGHVLLEGAPGTAKTLMVNALARCVGGDFKRAQFTPDLLPSDLLGTYVLRQNEGRFTLRKGPIFTDILLADEINRAPPRTQSALLEAMQERQITLEGHPHTLAKGFFVVATQNPLEYEGTYPLPEAQLDRFLFKLKVAYPTESEEIRLLQRIRDGADPQDLAKKLVSEVVSLDELVALRQSFNQIEATEETLSYIARLVRMTRQFEGVSVGAGPRASVALFLAARAGAALKGRMFVTPDDVKAMAPDVLRHRLILQGELILEGVTPESIVASCMRRVEVPR